MDLVWVRRRRENTGELCEMHAVNSEEQRIFLSRIELLVHSSLDTNTAFDFV